MTATYNKLFCKSQGFLKVEESPPEITPTPALPETSSGEGERCEKRRERLNPFIPKFP
jgi:hypothetical protein